MAFSIGEAATTATPEVGREEKQEQLTYSCNINVMHQEMYDETYGVMYVEMYDEMCSTAFNRELRTEYNICKPVYYIQQCDTYAYAVKEMYDVMYSEMRSTVFNRECRVYYNIYETAYSQQIHTYTIAMEQCRAVDEQVGITMTHLAYCWDANKQCSGDEQVGIAVTLLTIIWDKS